MASIKGLLNETMRQEYARVAYYYYKSGLKQDEIAVKMGMSRQRVNRILGECVELGIVEINVLGLENTFLETEMLLEKAFSLAAVRLTGSLMEGNLYSELGIAAGKFLGETIKDNDVLGFSRGNALSAVVDHLPALSRKNLVATQLMGGWNDRDYMVGGDDIVHRFCERVVATPNLLYAPVLVNDIALRDTILKEPYYQTAYQAISNCTIAMLGIGETKGRRLLPVQQGEDFHHYLEENAVGEVCAHFYDLEGNTVESQLDKRIIAVSLQDLRRIPLRVGVAGGPKKTQAILGALKGGFINVLVTDIDTAHALLNAVSA